MTATVIKRKEKPRLMTEEALKIVEDRGEAKVKNKGEAEVKCYRNMTKILNVMFW